MHPVGEGQCIALGYESVMPLVLLTFQGRDIKPHEFPKEGSKAIAATGKILRPPPPPGNGGHRTPYTVTFLPSSNLLSFPWGIAH